MRPLVFVWENFGPYHLDRMRAVAGLGRPVVAIQFTAASATYGWDADGDGGIDLRTLAPDGPISPWRLAWRLWRACRRVGRADVFLCHYEQWPVLLTAALMRLRGRRVFAMIESKFDDYPRRLRRELGKALFVRPYHGALTPTRRSRDYLSFLGVPRARMALGYSTVSVARIAALSGAPPAPEGTPFAERDWVVVARLVPKKNIALALDAFALWLARTGRPRDLHLCGGGPLEAGLRAQADRLGIAHRVHFHGFVQTDAVSRQLARSLALLLPSTEEQFGLAVIEAQATGLPVLASTNVGACDVLIDAGLNGFILRPNAPASWAACMMLLSEDEDRWRQMARAARAGAGRGDVARFAEGVAALTGG